MNYADGWAICIITHEGEYNVPSLEVLDQDGAMTKTDAIADAKRFCLFDHEKYGLIYNCTIVDNLNRFPPFTIYGERVLAGMHNNP